MKPEYRLSHRTMGAMLLTLTLTLKPAPGLAAPSTEAPATPQPEALAVMPPIAGDPRSGTQGDARTIDLLIQMQQRNAGLTFNERARPVAGNTGGSAERQPAAATVPPASRVELPPTPPSGLFGSGATPQVQNSHPVSLTAPGMAGEPAFSRGGTGAARDGAVPLPEWLLWPRELYAFARENRMLVVGGAFGTLLLFWVASLLFTRRRS